MRGYACGSKVVSVNFTLSNLLHIAIELDAVKGRFIHFYMSTQTKSPAKKNDHHHGDLKNALVKAGIDLLEEGGIDGLSLRKCAARAGVSHSAPAHHFDGLDGLKAAIADEGFRLFAQHLEQEMNQGDQSPRGRLLSICRGYLRFGLQHSGLLAVIFGNKGLAGLKPDNDEACPPPNEALLPEKVGTRAYQLLSEACAPFVPAGLPAIVVELQVWSLIHGFTMLYVAGEFGAPPPPIAEGPFSPVMALLDSLQPQA